MNIIINDENEHKTTARPAKRKSSIDIMMNLLKNRIKKMNREMNA